MATFTLDQLKETVASKYEPLVIENGDDKFVLTNLLQLPEKRRNKVLALTAKADDVDTENAADAFGLFEDVIIEVTEDNRGKELVDLVDGNTAILTEIFTEWAGDTQLGEA